MSQADRPNLPPEPTTARRAVQTGGRLLLAAGVLFVGYWTVTRFTRLLNDREPAAVPTPSEAAGPTTTEPARLDSLALSQLGGSWEFIGAGWSLEIGTVSSKEQPQPPLDKYSTQHDPPAEVDPVERAILSLFESLDPVVITDDGQISKMVVRENFAAAAGLRSFQNTFRLDKAYGILSIGPDQWVTISAVRSNQKSSTAPTAGLMPSVAGVERLAVRRGPGQAIVGEFSKAALKMEPLLKLWQAAGAPVTLNDGYGVVDTREGTCTFNGRSLRVILWQPEERNETTILVLDPSAAEAVPK